MTIMPNNLNKMITASGLSKREVAGLKGVTPETLSRHISGKIGISLSDAEQYARILGCTAKEVFFAADPMPGLLMQHWCAEFFFGPSWITAC